MHLIVSGRLRSFLDVRHGIVLHSMRLVALHPGHLKEQSSVVLSEEQCLPRISPKSYASTVVREDWMMVGRDAKTDGSSWSPSFTKSMRQLHA